MIFQKKNVITSQNTNLNNNFEQLTLLHAHFITFNSHIYYYYIFRKYLITVLNTINKNTIDLCFIKLHLF